VVMPLAAPGVLQALLRLPAAKGAGDPFTVETLIPTPEGSLRLLLVVQPASETRSVVHGRLESAAPAGARIALLRACNLLLAGLREALEVAPPAQGRAPV